MRALVWDGDRATLREHPEPDLAQGAVVSVSVAGVCATDLEITRGYMDYQGVLGHEFVGHVEAGPADWIGARVVGEINVACGTCRTCAAGLGRHCPTRRVIGISNHDGAFAERIALPVANLHRVPEHVPDDAAVFTEPLAAAFEILEQIDVDPSRRCLVFGDGRLGQLISQVLQTTGAVVTTVGKHADKLALLEARGISTRRLADWEADPQQADLVVEASGSAARFARAASAPRPRGTLVLKSTLAEAPSLDLAPLVVNEINVVGSRCGPFEPALAALADGSIEVEPLIAARFPLQLAQAALARAGEPGVLKVLIDCSD